MAFNPNEHLTKLKNKDYLEVKWRLVWLRDACPNAQITTSLVHLDMDKGVAVFKASVDDGNGGVGEGHGSESVKDFGDYIEKAETKAIGRALAALGYGTQFAPEIEEGARIVDSPVASNNATPAARPAQTAPVSEKPAQPSKPDRAATNAPLVPDAVRNLKSQAVDAGIVHNLAEWMAYKESVLKKQVKDSELDEQQIKTLRAALDIDKQAQKAS